MKLLRRIPLHVSLLLLVAWSALPFVWTFQTSIKFTRDVASREPVLWGYDTTANGYEAFWFEGDINMWSVLWFLVGLAGLCALTYQLGKRLRLGVIGNAVVALLLTLAVWSVPKIWETSDQYRFFVNSLIVTVLTVVTSIGIGVFAGYGLARYRGVSGAIILIVALGFRSLPRFAFVLPFFFLGKSLGILDSRLVIVMALVAINQPFTIWMLRSFFMDVPRELEEAAVMDGATRFQAFRQVILPTMKPGIIATSLFTMMLAYNEFLIVRVLAPTNWTMPVGMVALVAGESSKTITEAAAAGISVTIPIIIVIIFFQKHLVKGLGAGAVKG
jgi:ABC-type glycerol-3-phosphate transport system permease component